ncbi:DUF58 domain-containing protein [Vibrio genomosp. F10 str. 9ZC157]|uniref:MoxR protein n=1 Tax=Vibrio genomosp. F10 str. ZF-129 TaxID=1187848 RepID=A0A1E5BJD4_9VIBR|nr:DUF58 domain-containing protein [Vibrio genomosp. F10]OEE37113.1 MoxR protein [Vibrio genomosp. F10 str. ZF-129]OEE94103.1 MoxR protein [Vibrio genomosp. F10 str. 9ZC157]
MAKPTQAPKSKGLDPRLYCDYARLVRLQAQAESFSLLPHLKAGSALSGRHSSMFRGRGLNFEELRHYQRGDDIRNLDWKVTMRTGKPHVRSYTEEKDRNVIICIDQRSAMFFASQHSMKSVVAAEVAAICGWRVLKEGDRVGFMTVSHQRIFYSQAQRSQSDLLFQLKRLALVNQSLNVSKNDHKEVSFERWIEQVTRMRLKQSTLIFISDWRDCQEQHLDRLKQLQQHNDILAIMVSDPLEQSLPQHIAKANWIVGDGSFQINLDSASKVSMASESLSQRSERKKQSLAQLMAMKHLPYIELDTSGDHISQLQKRVVGR